MLFLSFIIGGGLGYFINTYIFLSDYSLLIATDVLSEGVNLQAGQVIINYDFHWNPTRLIQRAGRVDRIGSKNDFVTVHNFLLDPKMKEDFRLEGSVDLKIDDIQKMIGEDYKILKEEELVNTEDIYAIYKGGGEGDESVQLLDREEEKNPLEPTKFEKILRDIMQNEPEEWDKFKAIPDGIRCSGNVKSDGQLLLDCGEQERKIKKHYLISSENEIEEITTQKALELLESDDNSVYSTPENYDKLLSFGWKKFVKDTEQIMAKENNDVLSPEQRWVLQKLLSLASSNEFSDKKDDIDKLHKAFSSPFLKSKLKKSLRKIRKSGMDGLELFEFLNQTYKVFKLYRKVEDEEKERNIPRILYSKYMEK